MRHLANVAEQSAAASQSLDLLGNVYRCIRYTSPQDSPWESYDVYRCNSLFTSCRLPKKPWPPLRINYITIYMHIRVFPSSWLYYCFTHSAFTVRRLPYSLLSSRHTQNRDDFESIFSFNFFCQFPDFRSFIHSVTCNFLSKWAFKKNVFTYFLFHIFSRGLNVGGLVFVY